MNIQIQNKILFQFLPKRAKNFFLYFIFLFSFHSSVFSQNWLWARNPSGTGEDEGMAVSTDAAGNVFIAGGFAAPMLTFGSTTLINGGNNNTDVFLAKYDANGNVLWAKGAGGTGNEIANAVCADVFGNVYVCGNYSGPTLVFGSTTLNNASGEDIFIAKYDAVGNVLWAKSSVGTGTNEGYSVTTDANGNAFITGYFGGPSITFGSVTLANAGSDDIFFVKYDPSGTVQWAKRAGGTSFDIANSVGTDASGNIFITGRFFNTITFGVTSLTSSGGADVFIAKYDTGGNVLWAKKAGSTGNDMSFSVSSGVGGNAVITGAFYSPTLTFGSTVLSNSALCNVFIAKYDASGSVLLAKSAAGSMTAFGKSVSMDNSGNITAVGLADSGPSISFDATLFNLDPSENYYIVKYDSGGNVQCASVLAGGVDDLAVSADNNGGGVRHRRF
jgi:hypothetical protein